MFPQTDTEQKQLLEQVEKAISFFSRGEHFGKSTQQYKLALEWLKNFPGFIDPKRKTDLFHGVQATFNVTEAEIYADIAGLELPTQKNGFQPTAEQILERTLPQHGWLRDYAEYSRFVEIPMSYSLFCSLVVLGAALGRRVFLPEGHHNIYPNLSTLLIGPPAKLHKSTAVNMAKKLVIQTQLCSVFPDKLTPEALITELKLNGLEQFIGASELSMFFGKQRYNEGLIPTFLKMLDTEDVPVKVSTQARGTEEVTGATLYMIGGSTMSLLIGSSAKEVTSSGFLSRFCPVVEDDTDRCFAFPQKADVVYENRMVLTLERLRRMAGPVTFPPQAYKWYEGWYQQRWKQLKTIDDEDVVQSLGRGGVHVKKIAIALHAADHGDLAVCVKCLEMANTLLEYTEARIPKIIKAVTMPVKGGDADVVLAFIKKNGGAVDHSRLLRGLSSKGLDAQMLKRHIDTLKERQEILEKKHGALRFYILEET